MSVSVIIPSLGGNLCRTLDSLNSGSVLPDEIIICLPNKTHKIDNASDYKNLAIVYADRYGQVYQRAVGFKQAKGDKVLQLDDDMLLDEFCLERLISTLDKLPEHSAISPCLFNSDNTPLYQTRKNGVLSLYYFLINGRKGYQPGRVTRAGTNFGVNPNEVTGDQVEVEWQPGGCVLHRKENLILEDYYPQQGKAYCEDLMHSFLLRKKGVHLFVNTKAKCATPLNPKLSLSKEIAPDFKARLFFVRMTNLSVTRMLLHYMVYFVRSFGSK